MSASSSLAKVKLGRLCQTSNRAFCSIVRAPARSRRSALEQSEFHGLGLREDVPAGADLVAQARVNRVHGIVPFALGDQEHGLLQAQQALDGVRRGLLELQDGDQDVIALQTVSRSILWSTAMLATLLASCKSLAVLRVVTCPAIVLLSGKSACYRRKRKRSTRRPGAGSRASCPRCSASSSGCSSASPPNHVPR